jgi:hypothetical protein
MQTDETQDAVNNILNQLKNFDAPAAPKQELIAPGADELEEFVIKKSSELIDKSLQVLDEYRDFLTATPSEESAEAMSNLINASSSAIETLNKVDNNKRDNATRLMMTRRELMQMLVDAPDAIDVETQKIED